MKLAIISHTTHYKDKDGTIKGWGPTIREINFLASRFDEIIHLAFLHEGDAPKSCMPYTSSRIKFISLPPSGGKSIKQKFSVVTKAPEVISTINSVLNSVDAIQLRVPTGIANYLLPWLTTKKDRPLTWVKYAGNWMQENAPAGYRFQRWWLKKNLLHCKVTINGSWPDQPGHCLTFENPCLDEEERSRGIAVIQKKSYAGPYTACFIGRIESEKGVGRILEALGELQKKNIQTIHFIGEGKEKASFEKIASSQHEVKCIFHGSVSRTAISGFLEQSHFLLLPSTASEGFPKVIAEGANYGAIPFVSDISSIGQYVNETNGFVWNRSGPFSDWLRQMKFDETMLIAKSLELYKMAEAFTFLNYYNNLMKKVLNDH